MTVPLVNIVDNAENDCEAFPELRCSFGVGKASPEENRCDRIPCRDRTDLE